MAVNVKGGPLEFNAVINFEQEVKKLEDSFNNFYTRQKRQQDLASRTQQEYNKTILQTGQAFRKLDENIQSQLRRLSSLQSEIQKVKEAQDTLGNRKSDGIIGDDVYNSSMAALIAKENDLIHALDRVQGEMTATDAIMRAATGSIVQRTLALEKLKQEYIELSDADREDANIGGKLLSNIHQMDAELTNIADRFKQVQQHAVGSINERNATLARLKDDYSALAKTDRESDIGKKMLSNIHAVEEELRIINENMVAVQNHAAGSINAKAAELTKLKNAYAALSETDRRSRIGQEMARNIKGLDKEIQKINRELSVTESIAQKVAFAIGAFFSLQALQNFGSQIIDVRGEFQKLEAVLTNTFGDKNKAQAALAMLSDYAAKTPFELQEVSAAFVKLANQGFAPVQDEMIALGDLAASTGKGFDQLSEAIIDAQTGEFERLKEFGIRASKEGDKVAFTFRGITTEVKFTAKEIQNYILGLGKMEGVTGATAAISATLVGQISNLKDAWSRMLNDIGKDNEGVFSSSIAVLNSIIENYQTVIDILKVLVITYGAYRAAIIATNIATAISTELSAGFTAAELLRYRAMNLSKAAMKLLNATMLANPYVAVTTAVVALVSAFLLLKKEAKEVAINTDQFNAELKKERDHLDELFKSAKGAAEGTEKRKNAILLINKEYGSYLPKLLSEVSTNNDLAQAYENLNKKISENIALKFKNKNLDDLNQKFGEANSEIYNRVIGSVSSRSGGQKAAEAGQDLDNLATQLEELNSKIVENTGIFAQKISKEQQDLRNQRNKLIQEFAKKYSITNLQDIDLFAKNRTALKKGIDQINAFWDTIIKQNEDGAKDLKVTLEKLLTADKLLPNVDLAISLAKNLADYQAIKKKLEEDKASYNGQSEKDLAIINQNLKAIAKVDAIIKKYSGKEQEKERAKLESEAAKRLKLIEKLQEDIADAERAARRSGMAKEQSEIDKINERYDELEKRARRIKVDPALIRRIDLARYREIGNEKAKNEAKEYEKSLELQKDIFEQYEEAKKEVGIDIANQMFAEQTKGFDNFVSFLEAEAIRLSKFTDTFGGRLKMDVVGKLYPTAEEAKKKREYDEETKRLNALLQLTQSNADRKKKIEDQYELDVQLLRKRYHGEDLKDREASLKESHEREKKELDNQIERESEKYRLLNEDILKFTTEQIRERIKKLKEILKTDTNLTPQMEADIQSSIDHFESLLIETNKVYREFNKIAERLAGVANIFFELGSGLDGVNDGLADTLTTLGELAQVASDAASGVAQIATLTPQGIIGGIGSLAKSIGGIFQIGKKVRESERRTREEILSFQDQMFLGEQELNALYRERALEQARINKLKLDGIKAEREELLKQQKDVQDQFKKTLSELQQQVAVVGKEGEKYGGVLGIGRKTRAKDITESLAGKNYEQLEALFMKGQLEGKAKELFELLQRLKQEGADIDSLLLQNAEEFNQLITGTNADSITDSILDGFKNGLRGARDFADNFEDLMKNAILQSLKFQALEGPLKEFYAQFAADADSDGMLTEDEIKQLRERFNAIVNNASEKFEDFQQIANMNLTNGNNGSGSGGNLTGAIKSITADQANLLAGQFGGLRVTALDQLRNGTQQLDTMLAIQNHTSNLPLMYKLWQRIEHDGIKVK